MGGVHCSVYICVCFAQCVSPHVLERVSRYTVNL